MAMQTISFTIESQLGNVALVGEAVMGLCALTPQLDSNQIRVAVIEGVNNAVLHAYRNEAGHLVRVNWSLSEDLLRIDITDWGAPLDRQLSQQWPDDVQEGGRGGPLMWTCVDELSWHHDGDAKTLSLLKRLGRDSR